jgi:hypothetical protein|tara:strand:- start:466 stop:696 length:231 start_codon:yes stop_codon:yes gene_type:complete
MKVSELKKNDIILSKQLGIPIKGKLVESPRQGKGIKKTILIYAYGEDIGMFNEYGSIYTTDILKVKRDNNWINVEI